MAGLLDLADVRGARKSEKDITENTVEGYLVRSAEAERCITLKLKTYYNGMFDRIMIWPVCECHKEGVDFIETKRPKGGKYEPLQLRWKEKMRRMGYAALTILNKAQVDEYISHRKCTCKRSSHMPASLNQLDASTLKGLAVSVRKRNRFTRS